MNPVGPSLLSVGRQSRHFGIITPPVSGHLHPFGALGRELIERGHRVTVFHMPDLKERVEAEVLAFVPIGASDHPEGSLAVSLSALARLQGFPALRFTIEAVRRTTEMMLRDAPSAIATAGVDALLVDQTEPAGGTIAEHLQIPFITICNALLLNEEPDVPPPFTGWSFRPNLLNRIRNQAGYRASRAVTRPVTQTVSRYRQSWSLPAHRSPEQSYSPLVQISQQPPAFDFPRQHLPKSFHYVGPLRQGSAKGSASFPWHRLNNKPLIYASLGTLQNRNAHVFRLFAEACTGLNAQLVLTHGGGLSNEIVSTFPGNPVVVSYAPQTELLARAALTLTHAGLNTVLDSLTFGVPLVAIPITYEQPAIASRIRWAGVGEVLSLHGLTARKLVHQIEKVLELNSYQSNAKVIQSSISRAGGVSLAGTLIEKTLHLS